MKALLVAFALLQLGLPAAAQAPAGFRSGSDALSGLKWYWPSKYQQIPLAPTEAVLRARYQRKQPPDELKRYRGRGRARVQSFKPTVHVFLFDRKARTTPGVGEKPAKESEAKKDPKSIRELMVKRSTVHSLEELVGKRLRGMKLKKVPGKKGHFRLVQRNEKQAGYLVTREEGTRVMGTYGLTLDPHMKKMERVISTMARGLDLGKALTSGHEHDRLERFYSHKKFRAVEQRIKVRKGLSKGWKALDTENFIIVHHTRNERLVNKIARDVEAMRLVYEEIFPPARPVNAVSIIRVCRSLGEYRFYGGPAGTGGYWHAGNEELVFFDYEQTQKERTRDQLKNQKRRLSDKDSLLVLYHEALHQYIYYAVGQVAPHDWYNEGHGDYFSGAVIPQYGRKVTRIRPSPWRIGRAKRIIKTGKGLVPLKRLLHAPRGEFYSAPVRGNYYALAWSFVYFLRDEEVAKKHPKWHALLGVYFDELKKGYAEEVAKLGKSPSLQDKMKASGVAKQRAIKKALDGLPLDIIEASWKDYVLNLED